MHIFLPCTRTTAKTTQKAHDIFTAYRISSATTVTYCGIRKTFYGDVKNMIAGIVIYLFPFRREVLSRICARKCQGNRSVL